MHIAVVSPYPPFDGVPHAGGAFLHAYVTHFSKNHSIDLICTTYPEPRTASAYDSSVAVHFTPPVMSGGTSRLRQQGRTLTGFNVGAPEVDALTTDRNTRQILATADIVDLQWAELLRALPRLRQDRPRQPIVATEYDLYSRGLVRLAHSQSATVDRIPMRKRLFAPLAVFTETYFLAKCDLVQVFNRDEIAILRRCGLRRLCAVLDPLIEQFPAALVSERARRVIFASAFTRGPNIEGAQWFMDSVWPEVVRSVPGAVLVLAGNGSDKVLEGSPAEGVVATGYVADLKTVYSGCTIAVAPLLRGSGVKFKVPQALAYGLPVVTTTVGVEGLPPGCPAIVTDDARETARAVVDLLLSPDKVGQLAEAGRSWVGNLFDFSRCMEEVERRFECLLRQARK